MATRQCPFCGKEVFDRLTQCPYCREGLPAAPRVDHSYEPGSGEIRRGLLAVLLAALLGYFGGGYSALPLPFPIKPLVSTYLSPLLFLSGVALSLHGYYLQHKASSHSSRSAHSGRA